MLAVDLVRSHNIDPDLILKDPENKRVLLALWDFSQKLKAYGIDVKICNSASLTRLSELENEKKVQIRNYFDSLGQWITPESSGEKIIEIGVDQEKAFLKRALDHYGLWIDDEFWKTIQHGQIIEIYGPNMVQLYRNIHFFQYSSYTLLEISVFEWYQLWQRPKAVLKTMMESAHTVLNKMTPLLAYDVPRHVLRETKTPDDTLNDERLASLVQFKYVGSVRRGLERAPAGAIATSVAEVIAVGSEALQIQFV